MEQTQTPSPDLGSLDGLAQLQAMIDGHLPGPAIAATLGMEAFAVPERGRVLVELTPDAARHYNPIGTMHGGVHSTLLDTVCACSVHSTLAVGEAYTSLDLSVKFLRAVTEKSGRLRAEGRVVHRGRRMALAEATLVDAEGRLVATATSSCLILA